MADIPAWVLIANTLSAGVFGLAGVYLAPRFQREERKQNAARADAVIMRDKATLIFEEIAAVELAAGKPMMATMRELGSATEVDRDFQPKQLEDLRSLLAVYYPNLLPILDVHFDKQKDEMRALTAKMIEAAEGKLGTPAGAIKAVQFEMERMMWRLETECMGELRAAMIKAVRIYSPALS